MQRRHRIVPTIFFKAPVNYRKAVEKLKRERRTNIKSLMLEAIGLLMVKYEIVTDPRDLRGAIEFPDRPSNRSQGTAT